MEPIQNTNIPKPSSDRSGLVAVFIIIVLLVIAFAAYRLYKSQPGATNNLQAPEEVTTTLLPQSESDSTASIKSDLDSLDIDEVNANQEFQDVDRDLESL